MPKMRMRDASISIAILLCAMPVAARAQDVVDEDTAIERALSREGISARDDAERAASAAEIGVIAAPWRGEGSGIPSRGAAADPAASPSVPGLARGSRRHQLRAVPEHDALH